MRFLCRSSLCRKLSALLDDNGTSLSLICDRRLTELLKDISCWTTRAVPLGPVGGFPSCDSRRSRLDNKAIDFFCQICSLLGPEGALLTPFGPFGGFFSEG